MSPRKAPADDWPKVAHHVRTVRAAGQCQCRGGCSDRRCAGGRCIEKHGRRSPVGGRKQDVAYLEVVPADGDRGNRDLDNLSAVCQWCRA